MKLRRVVFIQDDGNQKEEGEINKNLSESLNLSIKKHGQEVLKKRKNIYLTVRIKPVHFDIWGDCD